MRLEDVRTQCLLSCFFFFQAEDGIRDGRVTGVQTCALPILQYWAAVSTDRVRAGRWSWGSARRHRRRPVIDRACVRACYADEIGRASCRERGEISVGAVSLKKKKREKNKRKRTAEKGAA